MGLGWTMRGCIYPDFDFWRVEQAVTSTFGVWEERAWTSAALNSVRIDLRCGDA